MFVISVLLASISAVIVGASLPYMAPDGSPIDRETLLGICPLH